MYGMNFTNLKKKKPQDITFFCVVGIIIHRQTKQGLLQECSAHNTEHT
jgi:hypothetical protein